MKYLIIIALAVVVGANTVFAQETPPINPSSIYQQTGVKAASPNQPGWMLVHANNLETVFEKRSEAEVLFANVKTIKTAVIDSDEEFLASLEALKFEELSKSNTTRDSLHFNYVEYRTQTCLQYDGVYNFEKASGAKFVYYNFRGYLCGHPESKELVVQMEFSNHSNLRGLAKDLISLSNEFFEKTVFSKIPVNCLSPTGEKPKDTKNNLLKEL